MARKVSKKDKEQPEAPGGKTKRAVKPAKARVKRAVSEKPPVEEVALPRLIKKKPVSSKGTLRLVESLDKLALKYNEGQPLLDKLTDSLRELTGFNSVQIVVLDEQRGWRFKSTSGSSAGLWDLKNFTLPGGFEEVFLPGMKEKPNYFTADGSLYFPRLDELPGEIEEPLTGFLNSAVERYGFNSLALVPIERENEVIGFVQLADGVSGSITSEAVEAVESITAPLQVALERSGLKDEMRRQRESLLKQMHERNAHLEALSERLKQEISDRKNEEPFSVCR